ncbi:hypothetical protein RAS12_24045 [Achromobacter seleniivolatilans]|uniref:Uncharacterized protein n=1 Tax=Achromobacter seleniivolatilans TaxID=3047478 RepID=A0ABY9LYW6_9BURK|nr:hypothetical protein [Achromobacter sp. R39]WMD19662.1 hypothetical protein RAS12_24045 [Achromobacter sp. R39]
MMYRIRELQDLYVDACIRLPSGDLAFLSFYGRDGSVQQLFASLQLGTQEGGLRQLTLMTSSSAVETVVTVGDVKRLEKHTGRLPKQTLFGGLLHCWIYDPALLKPSRATRSGWVLRDSPVAQATDLAVDPVWDLVKQISEVPLLDHWRAFVMSELRADLLADLDDEACRPVGRIHPTFVRLPSDFSSRISSYVRNGQLTLLADA